MQLIIYLIWTKQNTAQQQNHTFICHAIKQRTFKIKFRIIAIWSIINISKVTQWLLNNFKQSKSSTQYTYHWQLKDEVINQPTYHHDTKIWSRFTTQFYGQRTHPACQPTLCAWTIITALYTTKGVEWQHKKKSANEPTMKDKNLSFSYWQSNAQIACQQDIIFQGQTTFLSHIMIAYNDNIYESLSQY